MSKNKSTLHPLLHLMDEVVRIKGRLQSVFADASAAMSLPPLESTVLTAVIESQAPPTVSQIGRSLGHPRQVIQRAANTLIKAGWMQVAPNPEHKRAQLLLATEQGEKSYREALALAKRAAGSLSRVVEMAECERLASDLHELRSKIEGHIRSKNAAQVRSSKRRSDS